MLQIENSWCNVGERARVVVVLTPSNRAARRTKFPVRALTRRVEGVRYRETEGGWFQLATLWYFSWWLILLSYGELQYCVSISSPAHPSRCAASLPSPLRRANSLRNFRPLIDVLFIFSSHVHKRAVSRKDFKPVNLFSHLEREMQRKSTFLDLNFNVASILWDNLKRYNQPIEIDIEILR